MVPHAAKRLCRICFSVIWPRTMVPDFRMLPSWVQSGVTLWHDGAEAGSEELLFLGRVLCVSSVSSKLYIVCLLKG